MDSIFGTLKETQYKTITEGILTTFLKGKLYRYPGHPPMAELVGSHYEMGLQYGVLLKKEIEQAIRSYEPGFHLTAEQMGIPTEMLLEGMKIQAQAMAAGLPARFSDEFRGIADGCGMDLATVVAMALSYDLSMVSGCTGIIMKNASGEIMHGRHDDSAWAFGNAISDMLVIVKYSGDGYHQIIQPGPLLFLGVETGCNDVGLSFSEETLHPRHPNVEGKSLPYFVRRVLEESSTLDEIILLAQEYPFIGGYGMIWSSKTEKKGILMEAAGSVKRVTSITEPIFWNFNQYYNEDLIPLEQPLRRAVGYATDREALAETFPKKDVYSLEDMLAFLRVQKDRLGKDFAWCGSRTAICNSHTQQTTIFDPKGDGFYFAGDQNYAGMGPFYHYYWDFSIPPTLWADGVAIKEVLRKDAYIDNMLVSDAEKLKKRIALSLEYPEDANMHFAVAQNALIVADRITFAKHGIKAYYLDSTVPEYGLFASLGYLIQKEPVHAKAILDQVQSKELTPLQDIMKQWLATRIEPNHENKLMLCDMLQRAGIQQEAESTVFPGWESMLE